MAAKNRKDADPRYTWDLTQIYPSKEEFEKALSEAEAEIGEVAALSGKLTGSAGELKAGLDRFYALSEKLERAYCYAMLHSSTDNGEPEYQDMEGRAMRLFVAFSAATSFLAPRLLALPEDVLASLRQRYRLIPVCPVIFLSALDSRRQIPHAVWMRGANTVMYCSHGMLLTLLSRMGRQLGVNFEVMPMALLWYVLTVGLCTILAAFLIWLQKKPKFGWLSCFW